MQKRPWAMLEIGSMMRASNFRQASSVFDFYAFYMKVVQFVYFECPLWGGCNNKAGYTI